MIVIGIDPHKQTHTAAVVERATGELIGQRTVRAREQGHGELLSWARSLGDERLWALEDCRHVSGSLERFLLARGERVVRVPPRLMGEARKGTRAPGKSDAIDALAVARAALREPDLPVAFLAGSEREIRLLNDHREDLVAERTRIQQRLRWHLHDLDPGLGEVAGVERFGSEAKLAKHGGAAPLEASSGAKQRHRLNRKGNRQLNCALHRIAVTQARVHEPARAYLARKEAEGKSRREALRCLKRHLARVVFRILKVIAARRSSLSSTQPTAPLAAVGVT